MRSLRSTGAFLVCLLLAAAAAPVVTPSASEAEWIGEGNILYIAQIEASVSQLSIGSALVEVESSGIGAGAIVVLVYQDGILGSYFEAIYSPNSDVWISSGDGWGGINATIMVGQASLTFAISVTFGAAVGSPGTLVVGSTLGTTSVNYSLPPELSVVAESKGGAVYAATLRSMSSAAAFSVEEIGAVAISTEEKNGMAGPSRLIYREPTNLAGNWMCEITHANSTRACESGVGTDVADIQVELSVRAHVGLSSSDVPIIVIVPLAI